MNPQPTQGIVVQAGLSETDHERVEHLVALCNAHEGLNVRVTTDVPSGGAAYAPRQFVARRDGQIVGFASLDGDTDCEASGLVHPEHRRVGVGRRLVEAVAQAWKDGGGQTLLLVSEDASESGKAFLARIGAEYRFAEHLMELDVEAARHQMTGVGTLELRRADVTDASTIAQLASTSHGDDVVLARERVERHMRELGFTYYIGSVQGEPIGSLRVERIDGIDYIYAFAVLPQARGRGYGRQILEGVIREILASEQPRLRIEVQTDNRNALGLYQSVGFKEIVTYRYYEYLG